MEHKLRILWNSNAPYSMSGYGMQTAEITPLIRAEGYKIARSNFFGQAGGKFILEGQGDIVDYPVINHTYGSDALLMHGRDFKADVHMTLQDVWVLNPQDLSQIARWIPWLPIDQDPIPDSVVNNLHFAYRIISMSHFGEQQLINRGFSSTYIPHSVNTDIFKPMDKMEMRKKYNVHPGAFLVGMVAANKENPPRKSFQEVMDAFKMMLDKVPNALLYIHSFNDFPGGFPIQAYAQFIGIRDRIAMPDPYLINFNTGKKDMAEIYNTLDVLAAPSISEGFGIPVIEAQACGIPVIVNDFTAQPELIRDHITGFKTKVAYKRFSPAGSYFGIPDMNSIYEGLMWAYTLDRKQASKQAVKWVEGNYATELIWRTKWVPFLQKVENEVYGVPQKPLDIPQIITHTK